MAILFVQISRAALADTDSVIANSTATAVPITYYTVSQHTNTLAVLNGIAVSMLA